MTLPPDPYSDPNHPLYGQKPHLYGDPYKVPYQQYPPYAPGFPQQFPQKTVWKERKQTSHTFHLLMSVLTCGLWALFVWGPMAAWNAWGPKHKRTQRNY